MPVVPANFRAGSPFQPLDPVNQITKFDGAVAGGQGRIQDGTWVRWTATGVQKAGGTLQGIKASFCCFSDFDQNDVLGHPDASRLGQVTLLVGQYRARTLYWQRLGPNPAPGSFGEVGQASGGTAGAINTDAGVGDACVTNDGVLDVQNNNVTANNGVVLILTAPDANNFIEYMML